MDRGIEDETPTDELEAEIASTQDYQDRITTWKTRTKRLIERSREYVSARVSDTRTDSVRSYNQQTVKLPKLVIVKYSGEMVSQIGIKLQSQKAYCLKKKKLKLLWCLLYINKSSHKAKRSISRTLYQ